VSLVVQPIPRDTTRSEAPVCVHYPVEDGEPLAETPVQIHALILILQALEDFLAARTEFYFAANMFWYWEEGCLNA
jgi:hypothetical protein